MSQSGSKPFEEGVLHTTENVDFANLFITHGAVQVCSHLAGQEADSLWLFFGSALLAPTVIAY